MLASVTMSKAVVLSVMSKNVLLGSCPAVTAAATTTTWLHTPRRTLRIPPSPPHFDVSNFPVRYRLPVVPKYPQTFGGASSNIRVPKGKKDLFRLMGEELVHNKLLLGQYAIIAIHGGTMKHNHFEMLRKKVTPHLKQDKSFAFYRVDPPYKPATVHGAGKKLGGGKGSISHYTTPVKAGRVILEVGGNVMWEEIEPMLSYAASLLPFEAIAVSQELLDRLNANEQMMEETNENPYTFEWLVRNNMMDCQAQISPKDRLWFGRFVYRDRSAYLNKKWNLTRESKYRHR